MSYQYLTKRLKGIELPVMMSDDNGQVAIISKGRQGEFIVETAQDNYRMRINCYYPDGLMTETYE